MAWIFRGEGFEMKQELTGGTKFKGIGVWSKTVQFTIKKWQTVR